MDATTPAAQVKRRVVIADAIEHDRSINGDVSADFDDAGADGAAAPSPIFGSPTSPVSPSDDMMAADSTFRELSQRLRFTQSFVMVPGVTSRKHSRANLNRGQSFSLNSPNTHDLDRRLEESNGSFAANSSMDFSPYSLPRADSQLINPKRMLSIAAKVERKEASNRAIIEAFAFNEMWSRCVFPFVHHTRLLRLHGAVEQKLSLLQRSQEYWWRCGLMAEEAVMRCELDETFTRTGLVAERTFNVRQYIKHIAEMRSFMAAHENQKRLLEIERQNMRERRLFVREADSGLQWLLFGHYLSMHKLLSTSMHGFVATTQSLFGTEVEENVTRLRLSATDEWGERLAMSAMFWEQLWAITASRELARVRHVLSTSSDRAKAEALLGRVGRGLLARRRLCAEIEPRQRQRACDLLHQVAKGFFMRHFVFLKSQRNYFKK